MLNNSTLTKDDLLKAVIMHTILLIVVIVNGYIHNKKTFLDLKLISSSQIVKPSSTNTSNVTPIKASLVDHQEVQQAVKRQEKVFADKVAREKKLEQQEQKIAKLTSISEQEAKKTNQEKEQLKKEKEALKKEQEILQKSLTKLKQQQQELTNQQAKLAQAKQQLAKKKTLTQPQPHTSPNQGEDSIGEDSVLQTALQAYYNKMKTKIVSNRKITTFFPENLKCFIKIKLLPNGQLHLVQLKQSSGNAAYDALSEQSIYKSVPFDMPEDPKLAKQLVELEPIFEFTSNEDSNL